MAYGSSPLGIPLEQVRTMKAQGYDNSQIIQSLQRDGYTSSQIADALNQLDLQPASDFGNKGLFAAEPQGMPSEDMSAPAPTAEFQEHVTEQHAEYGGSETEELVETIIDEKWNELVKDINKIIDWKNSAENKVVALETQFRDLKQQFERLHQAVLGKIGEYDKNILGVGAELKAMEKVFSKVLPAFTDNVSELSRIVEKLK